MSENQYEKARQERVDIGLRELSGAEQPPDLTTAVLARAAGAEVRPVSRSRLALALPFAALLIFGVGITIAVALLAEPDSGRQAGAVPQDPFDIEALPALMVATVAGAKELTERAQRVIVVEPTDEKFEALSAHERLLCVETGVGPQEGAVTAVALGHLAKLTRLRALRLRFGDEITGEDLRVLAGLPVLTDLEIWGGTMTGEDLAVLARFPNLRRLVLRGPDCQDGGLAFLEQLPRLRVLDIEGHYGLTAEDLEPLRNLHDLQELNLEGVCGLWPFSSRRPTKEEADGIGADDSVLAYCADMPDLEKLNLNGLHAVTDLGFGALAKLEHLTWLDITNCRGATAAGLAKLPATLEVLFAQGTAIDARTLRRMTNLRECSLEWCTELKDADLEALTVAQDLEDLNLTYTKAMTVDAARHLRKFPKLRKLNLFGAPWLRNEHLEIVGAMKALRNLSIGGLLPLTDDGLSHLRDLKLEYLDLRGNKHVTPAGIEHLRDSPLRAVYVPRRLREVVERLWPKAQKAFS